jgi:hypothetical protein
MGATRTDKIFPGFTPTTKDWLGIV